MDSSIANTGMDSLASAMHDLPVPETPLTHRFVPGMYIREIFMPRGSIIISKIHKTEHPFVVSKGHAEVWSQDSGTVHYRAPHTGITKPGTQRALFIHEDCIWTTFHPTDKTDVDEIEKDIIQEPDDNSITISDAAMQNLKIERLK